MDKPYGLHTLTGTLGWAWPPPVQDSRTVAFTDIPSWASRHQSSCKFAPPYPSAPYKGGRANQSEVKTSRIDPHIRLRRAIHKNNLLLVRRILHSHPDLLHNPDYNDNANTSLHLAASLGHISIIEHLVHLGHDAHSISLNTRFETPLMLAITAKHLDACETILTAYPRSVKWTNKAGMDSLMLAARAGLTALIPSLLRGPLGADPRHHDIDGNTALHYASASGELMALRLLMSAGASPHAQIA